jgi:uncharacterized protein (UPF0332 family)
LIAYRLDEAAEALKDAELLLDAARYRSAANRMYYAAFYAAVAARLTKHLEFSRHSGVIAFFDKEFIHTGIFPKEYSRTPCIVPSTKGNRTTACPSSKWSPTN